MAEDRTALYRAEVTFRVEYVQTWDVFEADSPWEAKKKVEDAALAAIQAGRITLKTLNKSANGRYNSITTWIEWPTKCGPTIIIPEDIQQDRLAALKEELEGEITIIDCSGYEVEA